MVQFFFYTPLKNSWIKKSSFIRQFDSYPLKKIFETNNDLPLFMFTNWDSASNKKKTCTKLTTYITKIDLSIVAYIIRNNSKHKPPIDQWRWDECKSEIFILMLILMFQNYVGLSLKWSKSLVSSTELLHKYHIVLFKLIIDRVILVFWILIY